MARASSTGRPRLSWGMAHRRGALAWAAASVLVLAGALSACMPEPGDAAGAGPSDTTSASPSSTAQPSPTPTSAAATVPTDCREILSAGVRDELGTTPLNDPAFGPSGAQPDGSLVCIWGDPAAESTGLRTTIAYMSRGPALDMLNGLLAEGYACYTPDSGTRCEKTWFSEPDLIPEGRTLFWREDVLIDTAFSNLAPSGYTSAIVASIFG